MTLEDMLIEDIASFAFDPRGYVKYAFPWGDPGPLQDYTGARVWQDETFQLIADHLRNPETRYEPLMVAVASGHGIGKSAFIGMLIKWGMDTCDDCRVVVTANTDGQLRTKTSPEILKWANMAITSHWFHKTATSMFSVDKTHEKSWRADFIPWSDKNPEAFAGLHNVGKRILVIMDEASAIHDKIWEVIEGALTDEKTEIIWIAFGNPTRNMGRFRECFRKFSKYWQTRKIDSRTVDGTNKKQIEKWQEAYGEDSDFFKVRVRGEFPATSVSQFISTELIEKSQALKLTANQYQFAPVILTCDPAWTGDDDLVIAKRQGLDFQILDKIPKNENDVLIANKIARYQDQFSAQAVFIDGGFGTGIHSAGTTMGRRWDLIWFSASSARDDCFNKRAEMFVEARDWLRNGGSLPDDDELYEEAIVIDVLPTLDGKYKFAPKDAIKAVLGRSPNCWDALALSFAHPVIEGKVANLQFASEFS